MIYDETKRIIGDKYQLPSNGLIQDFRVNITDVMDHKKKYKNLDWKKFNNKFNFFYYLNERFTLQRFSFRSKNNFDTITAEIKFISLVIKSKSPGSNYILDLCDYFYVEASFNDLFFFTLSEFCEVCIQTS